MDSGLDQWVDQQPDRQGWYWIKWADGSKQLWFYDGSDDDKNILSKATRFYGPLTPPYEALCDVCQQPATMMIESVDGEENYCEVHGQ